MNGPATNFAVLLHKFVSSFNWSWVNFRFPRESRVWIVELEKGLLYLLVVIVVKYNVVGMGWAVLLFIFVSEFSRYSCFASS